MLKKIFSLLSLLLCIVSCSSSNNSAPTSNTGKSITLAQAERLASVLYKNYEAGGARFIAVSGLSGEKTSKISGNIDYQKGLAEADLDFYGKIPKTPTKIIWTKSEVVEELPGLKEEMTSRGRPEVLFLSRPLTKTSPQDIVLSLLLGTGSTQRENPALIQQGTEHGEAKFLRNELLLGKKMEIIKFGERTTYWIGEEDGILYRLEAKLAISSDVTTIDFLEHAPVIIEPPKASQVVKSSEIPDFLPKIR
jgi:hypothetical protein